jgi:acyl-CoA reductase-like NAD-dependent aldehyde dehydrogenase
LTGMALAQNDSALGITHYCMFIDGEHVDSDEFYEVVNPANEEVVATAAKGRLRHADAAVAAAKRAHESGVWRGIAPLERAEILERAAAGLEARSEELTTLGTRENGATVRLSAPFSVGQPVAFTRYFADLLRRYEFERPGPMVGPILAAGLVRREPIGVCAGIVPWNFPLALAVWKAVPALAAGNTVVLKTDEKTPLGALEFARELHAAGVPAGVFNVITGDGEEVGARLAEHPDVRKIAFTGSTAVGREVMRAAAGTIKRVTLELGGKGPNIVLEDADLAMAVDGSIWAFLMHAGQACESGTRLLLPSSIHDEFIERLVARLCTLKVGDPLDPATDVGPLINAAQRDRVLDYIASGRAEGATVAHGGGRPTGPGFDKGFWVEPTLFTDVTNDMRIAREEIFGPVLSVIRYDSVDDAIKIANDSEYGLSAGVWSRDNERALDVAKQLEAGSVWINDWHVISPLYPFGGYKQSGAGRELGPHALDEYTEEKFISIDLTGRVHNRAFGLVLGTPPDAPGGQ